MNTKGIKFLAVLAVMVMAFAAVIVLAPADKDVDAVNVYNNPDVYVDPTVITAKDTYSQYYISDDASVKITGFKPSVTGVTFYVQNGKELELNIKFTPDDESYSKTVPITIVSVTSDKQSPSTSTVDIYTVDPENVGKIILWDTELTFNGVKGQTVVYESMMPAVVETHTTSEGNKWVVVTEVNTYDYDLYQQMYATISSDKEFTSPAIGDKVTIASGQYIDVLLEAETDLEDVEVAYGILITDANATTSGDTLYTFYAIGANAGSFEMKSGDQVDIKNGSITIDNGDATVKATETKGASVAYDDVDAFTISKIEGDTYGMTAGSMTVSGEVDFDEFIIGSYASVTIASRTTATGEVEVDGELILKNDEDGIVGLTITGTGKITALNEKLWHFEGTNPSLVFANSGEVGFFTGQFDVYAIAEKLDVRHGFSDGDVNVRQAFVVVEDTTVDTLLNIYGIVVVNEGVTLTITKTNNIGASIVVSGQYAQLINYGTIEIKTTNKGPADPTDPESEPTENGGLFVTGGYAANYGAIRTGSLNTVEGAPTLFVGVVEDATSEPEFLGTGFVNYGDINISSKDTIAFDDNKFINKFGGKLIVSGTFSGSEFANEGEFKLSQAKIAENVIVNTSAGAYVNIASAEIAEGASIAIVHDNDYDINNSVTVMATEAGTTSATGVTVRNVNVFDAYETLDLSGGMSITKVNGAYATLTLVGGIDVSTVATIGEGYAINFSLAYLDVSGTLTVSKAGAAANHDVPGGLLASVDGKVVDTEGRLNMTFISAKYVVPTATETSVIYTSLEKAVPEAAAADIDTIEVGGIVATKTYPVVKGDITVPSGMFVSGYGLVVGTTDNTPSDAPVIRINSGAGFAFSENINVVEGTILVDNTIDVNEDTIDADIKIIDKNEYTGKFMSLRVALANAKSGDRLQLSQAFEGVDKDLTIPAGVTVDATDDENGDNYFSIINANLVVDGLLIVNDFKFLATTDDTKSITVNGTIMDRHSNGKCFSPWWYVPDGVSYQLTIPDENGSDETWYVITNIDNLQAAIILADDSKVNIEGNPKLGDVTVYGTEDEPAEITFKGNVDAGTITMSNVIIKALDGKKVTATFADALGSITIKGAYVDNKLSIYSLGDEGVFMAGALTDDKKGTYSIRFDGITGIDGTNKSVIGWGSYVDENGNTAGTPSILFAGTTTAVGKKTVIGNSSDAADVIEGIATITGDLISDNNNKIVFNSDVEVLGGLVAKERIDTANKGSIEINGDLFVGALKSELYDAGAAIEAYTDNLGDEGWTISGYGHAAVEADEQNAQAGNGGNGGAATGAVAYISGKIDMAADRYVTVVAGALVDPTTVEDLESLDVIIDGVVWITVYGLEPYSMDGLKAPIFNAKVDTIVDAGGNVVAYFDHYYRVIWGCPEINLENNDAVDIVLDFNVFTVKIKTDGSVKAVYIDGILMETGDNQNIFLLKKQKTGTHEVKVEPAAGYTADGCILYTDSDEPVILPGMKFTFTEFDCENYMVTYNIKGTQVEPEPVPPTPEEESQWTITTILLVILVVLIAIMAVIVALRLNRS